MSTGRTAQFALLGMRHEDVPTHPFEVLEVEVRIGVEDGLAGDIVRVGDGYHARVVVVIVVVAAMIMITMDTMSMRMMLMLLLMLMMRRRMVVMWNGN
jgi:hypothetical protein